MQSLQAIKAIRNLAEVLVCHTECANHVFGSFVTALCAQLSSFAEVSPDVGRMSKRIIVASARIKLREKKSIQSFSDTGCGGGRTAAG